MEKQAKQRVTRYALVPAVVTPLTFLFTYGFSIGTTNSASQPIQQFYNQSHFIRYGTYMNGSTLELLWVLTASLYPLGGMVGSMFVRPLVTRFGRRRCLIYSQVICFIATALMSGSAGMNSYEALIVGRFVLGLYAAIGTGIGPIYASEISATHIRGIIGSIFSLAIAIGVLFGNVLGLKQILGTSSGWPYLLAVGAIPSCLFLAYSPWMPQSPRALFLDQNDRANAEIVLKRLRGCDDVTSELRHLSNEAEFNKKSKALTISQVVTSRRVRWQLVSGIVLMSGMQLNGINGIQFYLDDVFVIAGVPLSIVSYVTIGVTFYQVVMNLVGGILCDKVGRKKLLLVGNLIICVSIVLYTLTAGLQSKVDWLSYLSILAALAFITGFCIGPGAVTYSITPELFDQSARPAAMTLCAFNLWMWFALIGFITPYLFDHLLYAALTPFLVVTIATFAYIKIVVPETQGKSVPQVQSHFAKWNRVPIATVDLGTKNQAYDVTDEQRMTKL